MDNQRCIFTEGSVIVPHGLTDRTMNVLGDPQSQLPQINITRDYLAAHQDLNGYIHQQIKMLSQQVPGWEEKTQREMVLGDNVAHGILLNYSFLRQDRLRLMHQQAVFLLDNNQILVFTTIKGNAFSSADEQRFQSVIASYQPR